MTAAVNATRLHPINDIVSRLTEPALSRPAGDALPEQIIAKATRPPGRLERRVRRRAVHRSSREPSDRSDKYVSTSIVAPTVCRKLSTSLPNPIAGVGTESSVEIQRTTSRTAFK